MTLRPRSSAVAPPSSAPRAARRAVAAAGLLLACLSSSAGRAEEAPSSNVIEFRMHLRQKGGVVRCGLFTREGWLEKPRAAHVVRANGPLALCRFEKIAPGTYGISAFHDANDNGKLDTNLVGYPIEEYCASRNARNLFSAPSWDDAKFAYKGGRKLLTAHMK